MYFKAVIYTGKIGISLFYFLNCNLETYPFQMIPKSQYRQNSQLDPKCQTRTQIMYGLNCFNFHIMQEYKINTNRGKTRQDVIDRASAAVAGGQCSRGIQASICHRHQKSSNF